MCPGVGHGQGVGHPGGRTSIEFDIGKRTCDCTPPCQELDYEKLVRGGCYYILDRSQNILKHNVSNDYP